MNSSVIEYINQTNIINFLIMAGILFWIIKKVNISSMLEHSVEAVKNSIQQSENVKNLSEIKFNNSVSALEKLPQRIEKIQDFNKQKLAVFDEKIQKSTEKTLKNINNNIDKIISIEEKKISAQITEETVSNVIEKSKAGIIEMLQNNPQMHNEFITQSLEQLQKAELK